jgi:hypothetical protein
VFYFFLAEHLGMTVAQMLRALDARELTEWRAYFSYKEKAKNGPKKDARAAMESMFGARVIRKKQG